MNDGSNWAQQPAAQPATPATQKWYRRHWVQLIAVGVVGLTIGSASASGGSDAPKPSGATQAAVVTGPTQAQLDAANQEAADAKAEAASAKAKAKAELADERAKIAAAQAALDAREKKVSGEEAVAKANTFDGSDAKYLVGVDIKPGTYRATASDGCYYARLSSLDDNDIIENNNTDGPVLIRIKASDKAFQVSDCGTFTRIGA